MLGWASFGNGAKNGLGVFAQATFKSWAKEETRGWWLEKWIKIPLARLFEGHTHLSTRYFFAVFPHVLALFMYLRHRIVCLLDAAHDDQPEVLLLGLFHFAGIRMSGLVQVDSHRGDLRLLYCSRYILIMS